MAYVVSPYRQGVVRGLVKLRSLLCTIWIIDPNDILSQQQKIKATEINQVAFNFFFFWVY